MLLLFHEVFKKKLRPTLGKNGLPVWACRRSRERPRGRGQPAPTNKERYFWFPFENKPTFGKKQKKVVFYWSVQREGEVTVKQVFIEVKNSREKIEPRRSWGGAVISGFTTKKQVFCCASSLTSIERDLAAHRRYWYNHTKN